MWAGVLSALLLITSGCVRREGRNSDCKWPGESPVHASDPRHLSADAEFAEDLANRYADTHHGLRTPYYVSGEAYAAARNRCMASLFDEVAKQHDVPVAQISSTLGRNRFFIDLAENLPFVLFYTFVAAAAARLVWRRYPPADHGWVPGAIMAVFLSLAIAASGMMLGELWSGLVETWRVGNGHTSYRGARLPWAEHRVAFFAAGLAVMALAVVAAARHVAGRRVATSS